MVILISIAISAGVVFFLVLLGILWTLLGRRGSNEKLEYAIYDEDDDSMHQRPSSLLEHINEATRTTILGPPAGFENPQRHEDELTSADPFAQEHDGDHFQRAMTPDAAGLALAAEEQGRPAHARDSFDGAGDGELALTEGMNLEVLDDRDPK